MAYQGMLTTRTGKIAVAYFAGTLVASGVPLPRALRTSAEASRNALVQAAGRRVADGVERGEAL